MGAAWRSPRVSNSRRSRSQPSLATSADWRRGRTAVRHRRAQRPERLVSGRTLLLYRDSGPKTGFDLWLLPVERETGSGRLRPAAGQSAKPFANTAAGEMNGQFSPDGAAISYESDESGEWEIYLQPFGRPGAREQVSVAGGRYARWRRDGRELYYHAPDGRLMMVPMRPSSTEGPRRAADAVPLFSVLVAPGSGQRPQFVVTNDGERFLVNTVTGTSPVNVTMIMNWSSTR